MASFADIKKTGTRFILLTPLDPDVVGPLAHHTGDDHILKTIRTDEEDEVVIANCECGAATLDGYAVAADWVRGVFGQPRPKVDDPRDAIGMVLGETEIGEPKATDIPLGTRLWVRDTGPVLREGSGVSGRDSEHFGPHHLHTVIGFTSMTGAVWFKTTCCAKTEWNIHPDWVESTAPPVDTTQPTKPTPTLDEHILIGLQSLIDGPGAQLAFLAVVSKLTDGKLIKPAYGDVVSNYSFNSEKRDKLKLEVVMVVIALEEARKMTTGKMTSGFGTVAGK